MSSFDIGRLERGRAQLDGSRASSVPLWGLSLLVKARDIEGRCLRGVHGLAEQFHGGRTVVFAVKDITWRVVANRMTYLLSDWL